MGKQKKATAGTTSTATSVTTPAKKRPTKLQYPRIRAKDDLRLQPRYPSQDPTIFEVPGVLDEAECTALLTAVQDNYNLERTAHAASKAFAWRDVDRVQFQSLDLSSLLWGAGLHDVVQAIPLPDGLQWTGLNSKWRVYRYSPSQGFGPHFDEEDVDPSTGHHSLYTLLIYLSDVPVGGETVFYKSKGRQVLAVKPVQGLALLHAQGSQCLLHEGRPVGGTAQKWVLRSDVMVGPL